MSSDVKTTIAAKKQATQETAKAIEKGADITVEQSKRILQKEAEK